MAGHGGLVIHQHQRVRPVVLFQLRDRAAKLAAHLWQRGIIVSDIYPVAIDIIQISLDAARGLRRRPPRPSTMLAHFVLAVSQNVNLNLLFNCCLGHFLSPRVWSLQILTGKPPVSGFFPRRIQESHNSNDALSVRHADDGVLHLPMTVKNKQCRNDMHAITLRSQLADLA